MRKSLLSLFGLALLAIGIQVILTSSSNGRAFAANSGNTGAPGEGTTCRTCHGTGFGATVSIVLKDTLGNPVTSYTPGEVYDAEFTVNATGASRYGFQMVSLDSSNAAVNGFNSPASNTRLVSLSNGRQYAEHAGKSTTNNFSSRWTAPAAGTGTVTFYGGGAAVNNNGGTGGDGGNTTSISINEIIPVVTTCNADFQSIQNSNNYTVNFTDISTTSGDSITSWFWTFHTGSTVNSPSGNDFVANPTYTWNGPGTYPVSLVISTANSTCSDTILKFLSINTIQTTNCNTSFTYSIASNQTVSFNGVVSGGASPYLYSWDFGDNSPTNLTLNPTHQYANPGNYIVSFTAIDSNGVTCSNTDTITVNTCSADFTYSVGSNGTAAFTNNSNPINSQVAFNWNFGDGSPLVGTTNPIHTYSSSGTYVVSLSMFDSTGNCSATYSDSIVVNIGTPSSCNASYTIAKDSSLAFGVILYNTSSNFGSHSYYWNFGDGTTGSGRTPIHQYQSFGSYVVCLTISDTVLNCTSTFCDTVGMDTLGNLKAGFGLRVLNPTITSVPSVELNLDAISLYPNPAANQITLDLSSSLTPVSYTVMDITGKEVRVEQRSMSIERIDLTGLEQGIYFMVLNDGINQKVKKFIKR